MKISVIIPCYNVEKYIKDTIKVLDKDNNIIDKSKYSIEWIDKKTEKDEIF